MTKEDRNAQKASENKVKTGLFLRAAITGDVDDIQKCRDAGIEMNPVTDGGFIVKDEDLKKCRELGIDVVTVNAV